MQLLASSWQHLIAIELHAVVLMVTPDAAASVTLNWVWGWSIRGMMGTIQGHTYLMSIVWTSWILLLLLWRAASIRWFVLVWIIRYHRLGLKLREIWRHPISGRRTHLVLRHRLLLLEHECLHLRGAAIGCHTCPGYFHVLAIILRLFGWSCVISRHQLHLKTVDKLG